MSRQDWDEVAVSVDAVTVSLISISFRGEIE